MKTIFAIVFVTMIPMFANGVGITFTFDNPQITGENPTFFEFDVMVAADTSGTKIGDTQAYINYNMQGFGQNVSANGTITISKGAFINNSNYRNPIVSDNGINRVSIATEFQGPTAEDGSDLPIIPTQLLHISLEIQDETETSSLSFQQSLMIDQQFESDNLTKYAPVIAEDTDDSPLYPTSVSVLIPIIPKKFNLYQNFPNPFNPTTTIRFDIPLTGSGSVDTKLVIYNSLGQVVKTLSQDKLSAGSYEVQWDGTTDRGHHAPSGIYFAVFKADRFSQTRKLVLMK